MNIKQDERKELIDYLNKSIRVVDNEECYPIEIEIKDNDKLCEALAIIQGYFKIGLKYVNNKLLFWANEDIKEKLEED